MMSESIIRIEVDTSAETGPSVKINDTEVWPLMKAVDDFAETIGDGNALIMFAALTYRVASGAAAEDAMSGGYSAKNMVLEMFEQSYNGFRATRDPVGPDVVRH